MAKLPDIDLDLKLPKPPFWMVAGFLILVILTWLPLVFIARARVTHSNKPRVHLFHDMDHQAKVKTQRTSTVFADGRSMRPPIEGTVARGGLEADDHFYRGYQLKKNQDGQYETVYFKGLPEEVDLDRQLVEAGRKHYQTFCYPCHGTDGYGNGPVHRRASSLMTGTDTTWIQPTSLHSQTIRERSDGYLFNVIGNGVRNMPGYASQIDPRERWSIVAYMRAMQLAERFPYEALPKQQRQALPKPDAAQPSGQ
jgi:mono/diheme cytochrome c family protein